MLDLAWKGLGWFLAGVAVALGFLLVPLQVAAERKKLDHAASEIQRAKRDIRALETEFDTRANLAQLDKWNAELLGLVAPAAEQFVSDERALAAIEPTAPSVQVASFVPDSPVAPMASQRPVETLMPEPAARPEPARAMAQAPAPRRTGAAVAMLDRALLDDSMMGDLRRGARAELARAR